MRGVVGIVYGVPEIVIRPARRMLWAISWNILMPLDLQVVAIPFHRPRMNSGMYIVSAERALLRVRIHALRTFAQVAEIVIWETQRPFVITGQSHFVVMNIAFRVISSGQGSQVLSITRGLWVLEHPESYHFSVLLNFIRPCLGNPRYPPGHGASLGRLSS